MQSVQTMQKKRINVRAVTMTGMLSAVAYVLMLLDFSIPIIPSFVKMDFSELPALIGAFAFGPVSGVAVCLVKNLLHLLVTSTGGVGELANFLLGAAFVFPAGLIYKRMNSRKGALIGSVVASAVMAAISLPINLYITYPFYTNFMPMESIIGAYQAIIPWVDSLTKALLIFNVPFNFVLKGLGNAFITFLIYKKISPLLKGRH